MATSNLYGNVSMNAFTGKINWTGGAVKVMLVASSYVPNFDTHVNKSDVSGELATGNGYTARGKILGNPTIVYDSATNTTKFDGDDTIWTTSSLTAKYAIVYLDSGTDSTSSLIACIDFGGNMTSSNGDFRVTWDSAGIFTVQAN